MHELSRAQKWLLATERTAITALKVSLEAGRQLPSKNEIHIQNSISINKDYTEEYLFGRIVISWARKAINRQQKVAAMQQEKLRLDWGL